MNQRVLVTDKVHPVLIEGLIQEGYQVDYDTTVDNEKLDHIIHQYNGLVINSKILMNAERIQRGPQLKFIGRLGSGLEIIDVPYARKRKIRVLNSPEGNCHAVAEHEMGMLLLLFNHLRRCDSEVRQSIWLREKNRGTELRGKTVGIIGMGHTGCALAEKLSSWRLNVISYDKYRKRYPGHLRSVTKASLEEVLETSDVISLHLPLTEETRGWINTDFLNQCKDGVILSNTSRGPIVVTRDLISALKSGKAGGACLDVFENEKPDTYTSDEKEMYDELFSMENVIFSPHVAGWTHESLREIAEVLLTKILRHRS
jgi:D-3-phosphoglycerate dehydrogenase